LYNGKSTSNAKKTASRENGKKGGRPPKQITQMKRRRLEIDALVPDLEHKIKFAENLEEENKLKKQIEELKKENQEISSALEQYTKGSLKSEN
jgi:protein-arginine kinase activator protein McsA